MKIVGKHKERERLEKEEKEKAVVERKR